MAAGGYTRSPVGVDDSVNLSGFQTQVIMDSLARTRIAAQASVITCKRAVTAFEQEVANISEMQDVDYNWLAGNTSSGSSGSGGPAPKARTRR